MVLFVPRCLWASACALEQDAKAFTAGNPSQSRLASVIQFGQANKIPFGIESTVDLNAQTVTSVPAGKVSSMLKVLLGSTSNWELTCLRGTILIQNRRVAEPAWLNKRVPEFRIPRSTLGMADTALWMQVELLLNPNQGGFTGDIPGDNPADKVGPYNIKGTSVRSLLCQVVASSKGAVWVVGGVAEPVGTSWTNRLWITVPYR